MRKLIILSILSFFTLYSCTKDKEGLTPNNPDFTDQTNISNSNTNLDNNSSNVNNDNNSDTTTVDHSDNNDTTSVDTNQSPVFCLFLENDPSAHWSDCLWDGQPVTVTYTLDGSFQTTTANNSNFNTPIACGNITSYNISSCSGVEEDYYDDQVYCSACDDIMLELREE